MVSRRLEAFYLQVFEYDQVLHKNPGTNGIKSHAFDSKYAFFSSVGDPGVLALLPCPSFLIPAINDNTIS